MKRNIQELKRKFNNKNVFIVAGGPSVSEIDINLLNNQCTIAINRSYEILPNASALYWCDASWISEHYDSVSNHNCELRFHARAGSSHPDDDYRGLANSTILSRTSEYGFDTNMNNVCGNNSGAHAINIAVNMKAKNIILLGYDMKLDGSRTHWHDGYSYGMRQNTYSEMFIPSINSMAKKIKELNINVNIVNANFESDLRCFSFDSFENYL